MNLKNPEAFRSWLIRQLEPICKANPEPVSKYVCALLKKEKSDNELKQSLISHLDIFLDSVTEEFTNFLLDVLVNDKYLSDDVNFRSSDADKLIIDDDTLNINVEPETDTTTEKEKSQRKSPSPIQAPTPSPPRKVPFQKSYSPRRRPRFRNERRRVVPRRSRREASSHSDSPLPERRPLPRKRSASGSSESSTKSPRRSWIASRPSDVKKYKHRHFARSSPVGQRSRSTSPKLRKRKPANGNFRKRPIPNSRSDSDDDRNHVIGKRVPAYPSDLPPIDLPLPKPDLPIEPSGFGKKQRCVDFEGKGYCARGDMCPYDHGPSPIVLDNNLLNGIVPLPPPVHNTTFQDANLYTPQYVSPTFPPAKPFRNENVAPPVTTRELINVPTIPLPQKPKNIHAGKPSYGHIFSSLPPGVSQTTIELTNVPADLNNIPSLYDNFSTFGNLTLIQAKRNGDTSTALLTFTNATEAALAFINVDQAIPAAKAAWYADKCILKPFPRKSIPASGQANPKSYVLNRKSPAVAAAPAPATTTTTAPPSEVSKPVQSQAPSKPEPPKSVVKNDDKDKNESSRQDPGRLLSDLIKKKRDLLEKQLASRKEIVEKMKTLEMGSKDEKTWQDVLKKLNDVIAENEMSIKISLQQRKEYLQKMNIVPMDSAALNILRQEEKNQAKVVATEASANQTTGGAKQEKAEDSELDIDDQLDESIFEIDCDLSILNQELEDDDEGESPSKVSSQPADTCAKTEESKPASTGPVEYTRVVVSGFENGDEDELLQHFSQFGTILDKEFDNTIPSATLIYDNRKSAEDAKKAGRNFQDRLLSVTVFAAKKFQPIVRRVVAFKPQYEKEFSSYAPYSGNPYKYKNPQISQPPLQRTVPSRSVYSYRADPKTRIVNAPSQVPQRTVVENNGLKSNDDDDLGEIESSDFEKLIE